MILELELAKDERTGRILAEPSLYQPSQEVKDRTYQVIRDFQRADIIRNEPYAELNWTSLLQRIALDQTSFNQYPGAASTDPANAWRSLAFRPIVRNKIISIAAHITASTIFPKVYAQNDQDEEDRDSATVMRDLIEWCADHYGYDKAFLYAVISALVNPASFLHTEYREIYRDIKVTNETGTGWTKKRVLDEEMSGFVFTPIPVDELWISNVYVHEIQQQPYIIWRRILDYETAREKYKDNPIFMEHVKPGIQFLYSNSTNLFYQQYDQSLRDRLVEEVIYMHRTADLQLHFVNGILMDDVDQPNPRKDKKYPIAKFGYELFDDGRFFYYKSLAFKLANDEEVINTAYRMLIDGTYIQIMPPAVVFGDTEIGSTVIAPGVVTTIDNTGNERASFQTIQTNNNLTAAYNLLEKVESSVSESSTDTLQSGINPAGTQTAFEISKIEQNARTLLGLFGKMVGFGIKAFGELLISDIIQFMTVGDVLDIENPSEVLKFRNFLLPEKNVKGKTKTKKIEFDMNLPDEGTDQQFMEISQKLADRQEKLDNSMQLYKVNPTLFRSLKFRCVVTPEAITPKSDTLRSALMLEEYAHAQMNPLIDQEAVTRELLLGAYEETKNDPDKFMAKQPPAGAAPVTPGVVPAQPSPMPSTTGGKQLHSLITADQGSSNLKDLARLH